MQLQIWLKVCVGILLMRARHHTTHLFPGWGVCALSQVVYVNAVCLTNPSMGGCSAGWGLMLTIEDAAVLAWHLQQGGFSAESMRR